MEAWHTTYRICTWECNIHGRKRRRNRRQTCIETNTRPVPIGTTTHRRSIVTNTKNMTVTMTWPQTKGNYTYYTTDIVRHREINTEKPASQTTSTSRERQKLKIQKSTNLVDTLQATTHTDTVIKQSRYTTSKHRQTHRQRYRHSWRQTDVGHGRNQWWRWWWMSRPQFPATQNSNEHEIDRTHAEGRGYSTQAERKSDIDKRENKNSPTQRQWERSQQEGHNTKKTRKKWKQCRRDKQ